jgi:hypothetical protein
MISMFRPALGAALILALAACGGQGAARSDAAKPETAAAPARPEADDNGWREYPLAEGVIKTHPAKWKTETIDIPVAAGKDLEYKLEMKKGDAVVYAISYGALEHPGMMVVEFHGHTPKGSDGTGDLMFYSKGAGAAQNGSFAAPWDGIHGWYLKNDSTKDVVVKLEVAGFYEHMS